MVTPECVGRLHALMPDRAIVHFEVQKGWICRPDELECVLAIGDEVRVKASVSKPAYVPASQLCGWLMGLGVGLGWRAGAIAGGGGLLRGRQSLSKLAYVSIVRRVLLG